MSWQKDKACQTNAMFFRSNMLSSKLMRFLKEKEWWFDEISIPYSVALEKVGISADTQISYFYLHAEDGPEFISQNGTLIHLCWFVLNTNYESDSCSLKRSLGLPDELIPLDSFEGEGGYFYNLVNGEVTDLRLGDSLNNYLEGKAIKSWGDFNSFLEYFFGL